MGWDWLDNIVSNVSSGLDFSKSLFSTAGNLANDAIHGWGWTNDSQYNEGKNVINSAVDVIDKIQGVAKPVKEAGAIGKQVYDRIEKKSEPEEKAQTFQEDLAPTFADQQPTQSAPSRNMQINRPRQSSSFGLNKVSKKPSVKMEPERPKRRITVKRRK